MESDLIKKYSSATGKKLILLDYDGTLVGYTTKPDQALPSERVITLIRELSQRPFLKVVIITGRSHLDIEKLIGNLQIDIIAEHGAMIRENQKWEKHFNDDGLWKNAILLVMQKFISMHPDSFIEEKIFSLTWHYRALGPPEGHILSRTLISKLNDSATTLKLKILDGNKVVEVMPVQIGKGIAVQYLIKKDNYDFIVAIGDDKTDEEMFNVLAANENWLTIKVGDGHTCAKYNLGTVSDVIMFLEQLTLLVNPIN